MSRLLRVPVRILCVGIIGILAIKGWSESPKRWSPLTSGPFYTGTADADPPGSGYYEPYLFDTLTSSLGQSSFYLPQKISLGIINNLEMDFYLPVDHNTVGPPTTPSGRSVSASGLGDSYLELKRQFMKDGDNDRFWSKPSLALEYIQYVPTGNYRKLNPSQYGADQSGNGTYDEGLIFLARKRFKPFEGYFQLGDLVENPTHVGPGYTFNNGFTTVPPGEHLRVVDGNLLYYSGAFEDVLNNKHGFGYLVEYSGQSQSKGNLFFGHATAPSWTYLDLSPEVEFTWPNRSRFGMTWGGGISLPVIASGYARSRVPMFTVSFYRNGKRGYRGERD